MTGWDHKYLWRLRYNVVPPNVTETVPALRERYGWNPGYELQPRNRRPARGGPPTEAGGAQDAIVGDWVARQAASTVRQTVAGLDRLANVDLMRRYARSGIIDFRQGYQQLYRGGLAPYDTYR